MRDNDKIRIKRSQHGKENPYFMTARATAQDENISYGALGLLSYLLSKPDNWEIIINNLKRSDCGRDKARRLLTELVDAKYVLKTPQQKDARGLWTSTYYDVYEQPYTENPSTDNPSTDSAALYNTDKIVQNKEKDSPPTAGGKETSITETHSNCLYPNFPCKYDWRDCGFGNTTDCVFPVAGMECGGEFDCPTATMMCEPCVFPLDDKLDPNWLLTDEQVGEYVDANRHVIKTVAGDTVILDSTELVTTQLQAPAEPTWWTKAHASIISQCDKRGRYSPTPAIQGDTTRCDQLIANGYLATPRQANGKTRLGAYGLTDKGRDMLQSASVMDLVAASQATHARVAVQPEKAKTRTPRNTNIECPPEVVPYAAIICQRFYGAATWEDMAATDKTYVIREVNKLRKTYSPEDVGFVINVWLPKQGDWAKSATLGALTNGKGHIAKALAERKKSTPERTYTTINLDIGE